MKQNTFLMIALVLILILIGMIVAFNRETIESIEENKILPSPTGMIIEDPVVTIIEPTNELSKE